MERIEISFFCYVSEYKWKKMKLVGENTHSSLFLWKCKFSLPLKFGNIWENEIRFDEVFTKTLKIHLYI